MIPKSENRFSDKIMRRKMLGVHGEQSNWVTL